MLIIPHHKSLYLFFVFSLLGGVAVGFAAGFAVGLMFESENTTCCVCCACFTCTFSLIFTLSLIFVIGNGSSNHKYVPNRGHHSAESKTNQTLLAANVATVAKQIQIHPETELVVAAITSVVFAIGFLIGLGLKNTKRENED